MKLETLPIASHSLDTFDPEVLEDDPAAVLQFATDLVWQMRELLLRPEELPDLLVEAGNFGWMVAVMRGQVSGQFDSVAKMASVRRFAERLRLDDLARTLRQCEATLTEIGPRYLDMLYNDYHAVPPAIRDRLQMALGQAPDEAAQRVGGDDAWDVVFLRGSKLVVEAFPFDVLDSHADVQSAKAEIVARIPDYADRTRDGATNGWQRVIFQLLNKVSDRLLHHESIKLTNVEGVVHLKGTEQLRRAAQSSAAAHVFFVKALTGTRLVHFFEDHATLSDAETGEELARVPIPPESGLWRKERLRTLGRIPVPGDVERLRAALDRNPGAGLDFAQAVAGHLCALGARPKELPPVVSEAVAFRDVIRTLRGLQDWPVTDDLRTPVRLASRMAERLPPTEAGDRLIGDLGATSADLMVFSPQDIGRYTAGMASGLDEELREDMDAALRDPFEWVAAELPAAEFDALLRAASGLVVSAEVFDWVADEDVYRAKLWEMVEAMPDREARQVDWSAEPPRIPQAQGPSQDLMQRIRGWISGQDEP